MVLFVGGLIAGVGSFAYHAVAGRFLGPDAYGQVAFLIAAYGVALTFAVILSLVLARYTASLTAGGQGGVGSVFMRASWLVGIAGVAVVLATAVVAPFVAKFEHMASTLPLLILGLSVALGWQVAIPRGILQGLQRFRALALNLALDPVVRVSALGAFLLGGYAISGAMAAVVVGMVVVLLVGIASLRDFLVERGLAMHVQQVAGFSVAAAAGVIGIQLLFNQDVVLAEHFLPSHQGGIYGGLNKIGTIVFYLTLSVSQVLFPRVVDAVVRRQHPGRLLLSSAGILSALGAPALLVFGLVPSLVTGTLYGPAFRDATPYVLAVGVIGLALSLNNMLVQFFIAVRDLWFVPILAAACVAEAVLISLFHAGVGQVVTDVLVSLLALLGSLAIRCYLLLPSLGAKSIADGRPIY